MSDEASLEDKATVVHQPRYNGVIKLELDKHALFERNTTHANCGIDFGDGSFDASV